MDTLTRHTIKHLQEGIAKLKKQLDESDLVIKGQAMQIIELMAQVRAKADTMQWNNRTIVFDPKEGWRTRTEKELDDAGVGMGLTAEELDDMEIIQEERKREQQEQMQSFRADVLDEM